MVVLNDYGVISVFALLEYDVIGIISFYLSFCHLEGYFVTVYIGCKVVPLCLPVISFGDCLDISVNFLTSGCAGKSKCDGVRSYAVLIIVIVPNLLSFDVGLDRRVLYCQSLGILVEQGLGILVEYQVVEPVLPMDVIAAYVFIPKIG